MKKNCIILLLIITGLIKTFSEGNKIEPIIIDLNRDFLVANGEQYLLRNEKFYINAINVFSQNQLDEKNRNYKAGVSVQTEVELLKNDKTFKTFIYLWQNPKFGKNSSPLGWDKYKISLIDSMPVRLSVSKLKPGDQFCLPIGEEVTIDSLTIKLQSMHSKNYDMETNTATITLTLQKDNKIKGVSWDKENNLQKSSINWESYLIEMEDFDFNKFIKLKILKEK